MGGTRDTWLGNTVFRPVASSMSTRALHVLFRALLPSSTAERPCVHLVQLLLLRDLRRASSLLLLLLGQTRADLFHARLVVARVARRRGAHPPRLLPLLEHQVRVLSLGEQIRRLRALDIPFTVTPGVPAFAAAAAALEVELTLPELAQSLVLTRTPGRASTMPPAESLTNFAVTGATLAIHLSIHNVMCCHWFK